jgi:polyphosphate kinase 2 (PPK2 family)
MRENLQVDSRLVHFLDPQFAQIFHALDNGRGRARGMMVRVEVRIPVGIEIVFFERDNHLECLIEQISRCIGPTPHYSTDFTHSVNLESCLDVIQFACLTRHNRLARSSCQFA